MGEVVPVEPRPVRDVDADRDRRITALSRRLDRLEKRLASVAKVQADNLPIFNEIVERIGTMRTVIHEHSNALMRIEAGNATTATALASMAADVHEILAWSKGAKTWFGFLRRHYPKALTFFVGLAVAKGWIVAENGKSFLAIFGL